MKCDKQEFTVWINRTALQWTRLLIKQTAQSSVQGNSLPSSTFFIPFSHVNKLILRSVNVYPRHTRVSAAGTWLKLEAAGRIPFVMSCNYNWKSFRTNWTRLHTYMYAPSHTETGAKEMLNHESWRHVVQEIETVRCLAHASGARLVWMLLTPVFPQRNGAAEAWFDMFLGSMALKEASFPPLHIIMMLIIARSCCYKSNSRHCGKHGKKRKETWLLIGKLTTLCKV